MTPSRWLEVRVRSASVPADVLVEALLELGGRAVWEEDGWQVTHLADPGDLVEGRALKRFVEGRFTDGDGGNVQVSTRWQKQGDWSELWRRGLDARRLTDRLVVTPTWIRPDVGPGDLVIVLDPGVAFGTAEHGTTRGCLRILDAVVRHGDRILDVGAGSGILSIAAALMGAGAVEAVEMDQWAVDAALDNVKVNGVGDRVTVRAHRVSADDLAHGPPRDGVIANLETGLLRPLLAGLADAVRPGGWLLLSGILAHEWPGIREEVVALGMAHDRLDEDGEWCSGLFRRPPVPS
ncbi:MAG: 50S ribosomal protein L11 methyltransferase [Gemmatimonadota bacterium]